MTARTTFSKLIERHGRVQIPVIQRDYAQGRADQHIVRDDFLKSLHDALCLPEDDPLLPLDLDFVYGSVVNGSTASNGSPRCSYCTGTSHGSTA